MKTLRMTNCLIGKPENGEISIYAPKTSACLTLPQYQLDGLLDLQLRQGSISKIEVLDRVQQIIGNKQETEEIIEAFIHYGVLVEQETAPQWEDMPGPEDETAVDVLLVVANYPYAGDVNTPVPFGVMLIANVLQEAGFKVAILDMALHRLEAWRIVSYLRQYQPKIVGISAITAAGSQAIELAYWINGWAKKDYTEVDFKGIVLGGHHATDFTRETLKSKRFEAVIAGKLAFLVAPQVFQALLKGREILKLFTIFPPWISGTHWYLGRFGYVGTFSGPSLKWQRDAKIPKPAWDLINPEDYSVPGASFWGMGCPHGCTYCTLGGVPKIYRPLHELKQEFLRAMNSGYNELALLDDEVFHNQKRTEELVSMFEQEPLFRQTKLYVQSRIDSVKARYQDGLLSRLCKALESLYVEMGMDGLTEKDLINVRKGSKLSTQSPFEIIKIAKQINCRIGFGSIFGFPWNTKDDLEEQSACVKALFKEADKLGVDLVIMSGVFTPFPGSRLGQAIINGELEGVRIVNQWPECFDFHRPNIDTPFWTHQYLEHFMLRHFKSVIEGGV